jgi:hypothetical protein
VSKWTIMPDRYSPPNVLRGSMEAYGIVTMTYLVRKAVTTIVLLAL